MRHNIHRTALAGAVVLLLCAGGTPAVASTPTPDPSSPTLLAPPTISTVERLVEVGPTLALGAPIPTAAALPSDRVTQGSTLLSAAATALSPAGCTGSTDYPHKSGYEASVHARMACRTVVQRLETVTVLTRDRWYGPEQVAADSSATDYLRTSYDAHPHWNCKGQGTYTYRGYSQHASLENGTIYKATTSNWQVPGVSRFAC